MAEMLRKTKEVVDKLQNEPVSAMSNKFNFRSSK
jgi:hypothetical protein